jgi:predicted RNA-binding Zn-ribbon protein involved in translation (DUF1610 family)
MKKKSGIVGKCPDCLEWLTRCPTCDELFCPRCGMTEIEAEEKASEENNF